MSGLQFMNQDGEWENFPPDEQLAEMAKHEDVSYSSKRLTEDFSRKTRARKERPTNPEDLN